MSSFFYSGYILPVLGISPYILKCIDDNTSNCWCYFVSVSFCGTSDFHNYRFRAILPCWMNAFVDYWLRKEDNYLGKMSKTRLWVLWIYTFRLGVHYRIIISRNWWFRNLSAKQINDTGRNVEKLRLEFHVVDGKPLPRSWLGLENGGISLFH